MAWVSPYHMLFDENDYLSRLNHVRGLCPENCQHYGKARTLIDKGLQSGIVHDTPCEYTQQFKHDVSSFYVHQHLYTGHPRKHEVVIIDEAPLRNVLRTREVSFRYFRRNYARTSEEFHFLEAAAIISDDYIRSLYDLAKNKGDEAVTRYQYLTGREFMQEVDNELHGELADILRYLDLKYDLNTLRPMQIQGF